MTLYNPIQDGGGSAGALANDPTAYVFGLVWIVSAPCQLNGVWWWCATGQYTNSLADEQIALWEVTGILPGAATYQAGTVTTAGTYTQNAWNLISFGSPITLTPGVEYMTVKGISSAASTFNYTDAGLFFASGTGTNGFTDGPVLVYSDGGSGNSNKSPGPNPQMLFSAGSNNSAPPNVTTTAPGSSFNASYYGMDIQIQTGSAPPTTITTYSMRLS